jgi:hypothetical protein
MKKKKELDLKVEFKNELDINVLDKTFYEILLNSMLEMKQKEEKPKQDN